MKLRARRCFSKVLYACALLIAFAAIANAREFTLSGVTLDLQEVTSQMDVYFTSMRLNRAVNEWNVEVSVSNKVGQAVSGPVILLVESFTGTTGPLRVDGTSTNQSFFDLSGQISQGLLSVGNKSAPRTIALGFKAGGSPKLVTRVYASASSGTEALGFARSLNGVGQPLSGVSIEESGPDGTASKATEDEFGIVTLGKAPGNYVWKFSRDGYVPVWRQALLQSNSVSVIPYPWLAPRSSQGFAFSPLAGGSASNQTQRVQFNGGSFSQSTVAYLTSLDGQTLPAFLPQGWSPVQAFWLEFSSEPVQPGTASILPWDAVKNTETAVWVKFNPATMTWNVLQLISGNETNALNVSVPGSGAYALVVADSPPIAPPAAVAGTALPPSAVPAPNPADLTADGTVTPATSPASTVPELVTGNALVVVTNRAGALASGTLLRGELSDRYILQDGTIRVPPTFENFVVGYQRPGDTRTDTLVARFPLRPLVLYGPEQLKEGVVHADLFAPGSFTGGILGTNGGVVASGSVRLLAGPGAMQGRQAIQLRSLNPTNFTDLAGPDFDIIAAFEVGLNGIASGKNVLLQMNNLLANATFVLARVVAQGGLFGLEPRARFHSDANGSLVNDEPASGGLPGLTVAGQYLLLRVQPQQGVVEGIAKNSNGEPAGGLSVTIAGQPWLTFSKPDGSFKLLAPVGSASVNVSDPATGDKGTQAVIVPPNLGTINVAINSTVDSLRVASVMPTNNAVSVPRVTSVVINFTRPVNPATLISDAVQLLGTNNQPVRATVSLNLANTTATLLPSESLDPATQFRLVVSTNIADNLGRTLEGQNEFVFTTMALSVRDPAAQLIVYEPGATNVPAALVAAIPGYVPGNDKTIVVVQGTSGSADPGVPVIVVDENSGETATVLSKPDGSFATFVAAEAQDFISATFVNLNGTRVYIPVNRQLFDDGSVGLYQQGGKLTAQGSGGPVQVTVPPNAIPTRAKFKLASINVEELQAQLSGVMPSNGVVAGSALNLHIEGPQPTLPLQVSFPVNLTAAGYPTNESPTNVAAMLAIVRDTQDVTSFEVLSQMSFTPQAPSGLALRGPRPLGSGDADQLAAGVLEAALSLSGPGFIAQIVTEHVLVPMLFGPLPVAIKGKVSYIPLKDLIEAGEGVAGEVGLVGGALGVAKVQNPLFHISVVADVALNSAKILLSKPLSGAFVTLSLTEVPTLAQPGRLQPGMVYATTGADGTFLIVAPKAGASYLISAEHPLYQRKLTLPCQPVSFNPLAGSLTDSLFKNFYFSQQLAILTPPHVNIAVVPTRPAPGQTCEVQVNASQPSAAPNIGVVIKRVGTNNLNTGLIETNVLASLSNIVKTNEGKTARWSGTLTADKPVRVTIKFTVQGQNSYQNFGPMEYNIDFSGAIPPTVVTNIPPPDTNDVNGPLVVETQPVENGFIGEDGAVTIFFNKPIDASVTNHLGGILLSGLPPTPLPIVHLSRDQRTMVLQYPGLSPDQIYRLTLSSSWIQDLAGQPLDQRPSSAVADSFTMTFRTPLTVSAPLPYVANGRGAVINGKWLHVLDQSPQGNLLKTYDIDNPLNQILVSQLPLIGAPRDLVVIPKYSYVRNVHATAETNDLVVVVGGDLDTIIQPEGDITVRGQYLWVVNMGNPGRPEILASPIVTFRSSSVVPKVRWSPPYLVYQEYGQDIQLLGYVNLQELIIGFNSTTVQRDTFPPGGKAGLDLNGDGDYVDPGDTYPIPDVLPTEFYGKHQSYVLQRTTQKILDFAISPGGASVGITLRGGMELDDRNRTNGVALQPSYRTLVFNGQPLNISIPRDAYLPFGPNAFPRWVTIFNNLALISNGIPMIRSVALVSLTPDNDGVQRLAVVDISLPQTPHILNKIPVPDTMLGGDMQSISMRGDGLLELSGRENLVLLDPRELMTGVLDGQSHPAILSVIKGAGGTTRSLGTTDYGLHAVADGARASIVVSPPQLEFVSFPESTALIDPRQLQNQKANVVDDVMSGRRPALAIPPARYRSSHDIPSDLVPPNPGLHFHVLVTAPGGAGESIEIGLEALNPAGRPLSNPGLGFAPVRAASLETQTAIGQKPRPSCGAPIRSLKAYHLSRDPTSPYFNKYLSQPFALVTEPMAESQLTQLKAQADREILFSGSELRAFIEPNQTRNPVVGPFAARIDTDRKLIYPINTANALSVYRPYLPGDNPPPAGGVTEAPGTYGSVCAHSGEIRTEAADMMLPSPGMPIAIARAIGNQDTYEGPFGVGWDFNYNQRLTELDPLTFPAGLQMPVLVRDTKANSEVAGSQDVLFHTGAGTIILFKWVDTAMPPEYAQDPLVIEFNYANRVSDYFLPEKRRGVFDLLVKFKDGRFERLTPEGVRYRYGPQGRLEMIIDRFPANYHVLEYDSGDHLVSINDRSVSAARFVQFGYYRNENTDNDFNPALDINTANPFLDGKICRLKDYAGADVLYEYTDDGFLERRLGKQMAGENNGFSGRSQTWYRYNHCRLVGVAVTGNGTPIFTATTAANSSGKPVTQSGTGLGNDVQLNIPLENSAASLNNQVSTAGLADGSTTEFTFDKMGHPKTTKVSGPGGPPATTTTQFDEDSGLLVFVRHPEGNTETMSYDTANPIFRSRGNLKSRTVDPGPRGGTGYTRNFNYEPTYNLMSGNQTTPNGFNWTYTLRPDKRETASITYGAAGTDTFVYNDNGQPRSHSDIRGVETAMDYDAATGFLKSRKLGNNSYVYNYGNDYASKLGMPATVTLPEGAPLERTYNANLQQVQAGRGDLLEKFTFDEQGRATRHEQQVGDGKTLVRRNTFDEKGFLKASTIDGVEVDGQVTSLEYAYTPDALSRVKEIRHPQGTVQTFGYDDRGNLINMTLGHYVEDRSFDLNDNVTSVKQGGDETTTMVYDGLDRAVTVIQKNGISDETETRTYYPEGQVKTEKITDSIFGVVKEESLEQIDEIGRALRTLESGTTISPAYQNTYAKGSLTTIGPRMTTKRSWDAAGFDTGIINPVLNLTLHPDGSGRVLQMDSQEDGATYNTFYTYNELDQRTSTRDNLGLFMQFQPRADGRHLAVTNGVGYTMRYEHTAIGELLKMTRSDGMQFQFKHDQQRKTTYSGDPAAGFSYGYDNEFRLATSKLRNNATTLYQSFDPRNMPQSVTTPGGNVTIQYDLKRRLTAKTINYQSTSYEIHHAFDALDRLREVTYKQDGGPANTADFTYDKAGPLLTARFQEDGNDFTIDYRYYDDGIRKSVKYPSGVTINEIRDAAGRLTGLSDASGNIVSVTAWQGNLQPKAAQLGQGIQIANQFDARGRLAASRTTRSTDGAVLSHMRYEYDGANNLLARQYVHRSGKADSFVHDGGDRLTNAVVGTVPLAPSGFTPSLYDRNYNFHASGLDYLVSSTIPASLTPDIPPFATNWPAHDDFLQPTIVDGFTRGPSDPMGNVAQAELRVRPVGGSAPIPMPATLTHNGNGSLVRVTRADGVVEENFFQAHGLRYRRQISQNGTVIEDRRFVYDDATRLLEEYNRTGSTNQLLARYYYAASDVPVAGDLLNSLSGFLERYYFLKDSSGSIVAVADANGVVVERSWYDPFGQPVIETRDTSAPTLQSIAGTNGSLLVALSESVFSSITDPGEGNGLVRFPAPVASDMVRVSINSTNIAGTTELLPYLPGYAPYSVLRFTPSQALPTPPSSLVSWWPADGNVLDVAGGHNGVLRNGATTGPGLINQAFAFNGTNAFVEVADNAALNVGSADFTVGIWANFSTNTGDQVLIEKWVQSSQSGWSLVKLSNNRLRLALGNGSGSEVDVDSPVLSLKTGTWIHFAARRQGNTFTLFTNGTAVASGTANFNLNAATSLKFGSREGTGSFLKGLLDEITLHTRALTDGEITSVAGGVSVPGPVTVTLNPGLLADEWGNTNEGATVSFQWQDDPGTVFYSAEPSPATAAVRVARSSIGLPLLFHGQYFDYDTGLIYLRMRFYDPFSGMFLEPDPLGYADSVNLYAGMRNNPVSIRDPFGLAGWDFLKWMRGESKAAQGVERAGEGLARGSEGVRAGEKVGESASRPMGAVVGGTEAEQAAAAELEKAAQRRRADADFLNRRRGLAEMRTDVAQATAARELSEQGLQRGAARLGSSAPPGATRSRLLLEISGKTARERFAALEASGAIKTPQWREKLIREGREQIALTERIEAQAAALPPKEGFFDVFIHGSPEAAHYGARNLGPKELADWIVLHPEYTGQKIRLISCETGLMENGFASQLAKELGVEVHAPSSKVFAASAGQRMLYPAPWTRNTTIGELKAFSPSGGSTVIPWYVAP